MESSTDFEDEFRSCCALEEEGDEQWEETDESFAQFSNQELDESSVRLFFKGISNCVENGPKNSGIGVVMERESGVPVIRVQKKMDFYVEDLVAEHLALLDGISVALKNDIKKIYAFTDSEKLYFQIAETEILEDNLLVALGHRILELVDQLEDFDLTLVPSFDVEKPLHLAQQAIGIYNPLSDNLKLHCPYPDCPALLSPNSNPNPSRMYHCKAGPSRQMDLSRIECHKCLREVCFVCGVPWHEGLSCEEFRNLPEGERDDMDELALRHLARDNRWRRCQQCGRLIELSDGCYHMTCWCGHEFCYTCGAEYRHGIQTCQCLYWDTNHHTLNGSPDPDPITDQNQHHHHQQQQQPEMWSWDSFDCLPNNSMEWYTEQERAQLALIQRFLAGGFSLSDHPCQSPAQAQTQSLSPPRCSDSYIDAMKDLHQLPWLERFVSVISDSYNEDYIQ